MSVNGHPLTAAHINTAETNDVNLRGQSLLFLHYIFTLYYSEIESLKIFVLPHNIY